MKRYERAAVLWFARRMEKNLRENDHKGGWLGCSLSWLAMRIAHERNELKRAIDAYEKNVHNPELARKVINESADVANFALMIADVIRHRHNL